MSVTKKVKALQFSVLCLVLSLFLYFYVSSHWVPPSSLQVQLDPAISNSSGTTTDRLSVMNGTKKILLWKNSWGYRFGYGRVAFINAGCRVSNCLITSNASWFHDYDAYVVHPPTQKTPWLLTNRMPGQIFVMFSTEPPYHMPNMIPFENYFNWTMSYRSESDFVLKYGEILPLESAPQSEEEASALRRDVALSAIQPARGKTKLAIWLVSNCQSRSNRQEYVKLMSKYVHVDIISKDGRCGGRDDCPRERNADVCYDKIEQTYKFYLSFENSICNEYVTEKFFEMMSRDIVPVVLGGADYASIAPKHSYINAMNYSPKQLAEYLTLLDKNDTLYAEYFWWKPHYRVRNLYDTNRQVFCDLCEALHTRPLQTKTATHLEKWYNQDAKCVDFPRFKSN